MTVDEPELEEGGPIPDFLRDPLGILQRRWPWMLAAVVLGLSATAVVVGQLKPRYQASATILVTSQRIPEHFVRSTVEQDSLAQVNAMMGQVLTRAKLAELVEEYGLYPQLRDQATLDAIVARVRSDIVVEPERAVAHHMSNETARLLGVQFEAYDPEVAAAVANEIASLFTAENIRSRSRQARLTTDFLRKELDATEGALRNQERSITEFQERHRGELPGELPANIARLERLQQQRQSLTAQIEDATNRLTLLSQNQTESPDERLLMLRAELEQQRAVRTERHPDVMLLRSRIEALEKGISGAGAAPAAAPVEGPLARAERQHLAQLRSQVAQTERRIDELDARVERTPKRAEELTALEQKATVLRENYLGFLRKVQEAELAQSLEAAQYGSRFTVLDRAVPPTHPVTSRIQFLVGGIVGSLLFALGMGVLLEILDPVLVASDQVERLSDLPVLGTVSHIG